MVEISRLALCRSHIVVSKSPGKFLLVRRLEVVHMHLPVVGDQWGAVVDSVSLAVNETPVVCESMRLFGWG